MNGFKGIVVVAGNFRQFEQWCYENHFHPRAAFYVSRAQNLQGLALEPWQVVRYGTYAERPDIFEIEQELLTRYVPCK